MASPAMGPRPVPPAAAPTAAQLLDIVERAVHPAGPQWMFFRELAVVTPARRIAAQRMDAFALNCLPYAGKRICYEVKTSRSDFLAELKRPLKRRIGMRYSNEFYFVTPANLVKMPEIPAECGLIEAGYATPEEWRELLPRQAGFFNYDVTNSAYCLLVIPAPWRDTPGPTWQLLQSMLRHQKRTLEEAPPPPPAQQSLEF